MKAKRNIYLVMDYGGDEINPWDLPYMAFDDEQAAEHCVEKHKERMTLAPGEEPTCNWDLYDFSAVCTIPFLVDEQTCQNVYRQKDWMHYRVWKGLKQCPSWWLDQNRFERA